MTHVFVGPLLAGASLSAIQQGLVLDKQARTRCRKGPRETMLNQPINNGCLASKGLVVAERSGDG
jgi:hypothetical protein